mmetsp:Transcript_168004/g.534413  ORF Transcript_168004/g.534413 Transcript_168004/m.534413 type:complete len:130 (+) Transcript_168004:807-1196(+)
MKMVMASVQRPVGWLPFGRAVPNVRPNTSVPQNRSKSMTQLASLPIWLPKQEERPPDPPSARRHTASYTAATAPAASADAAAAAAEPLLLPEEEQISRLGRQVSQKEMGVKQWLTSLRAEMFKDGVAEQ